MEERYDIIIVGSGLGGLECGVILSREGYKVLVLEKNKQLGGNLQTFARDKRIFDTGIHYIGGLDDGQNLNQYFKYLGIMDDLKLKRLDNDGYDLVSFDDDENDYRHAQGYENFIEQLAQYFPKERQAIVNYCKKMREVCNTFPMYNLKQSNSDLQNMPFLDINAHDYIASITTNDKLRKVLAGTNVLYAGEADKTPLYVHALVVNSYIESAYRCVNGSSQIAKGLTRIILNNGGRILKHAHVEQFHFDGSKIDYVSLKDGRRFYGKNFISNIHPSVTLDMIEEGKVRTAYRKRIKSLENSVSTFIVHIALKPGKLKYFNYNRYHYMDPDVWKGANYNKDEWPTSWALFTGVTSKDDGYADTLTLMTYMREEETQQWADTYNVVSREMDRGSDYYEFKAHKAEKLIDALATKIPNLKESIFSHYTSSPLSYRDYIGDNWGSLYGISKDYKNPLKTFISAKTKVPNLFLTGENLNLHGALGVTIGAISTCSEFLGNEYIMKNVVKA